MYKKPQRYVKLVENTLAAQQPSYSITYETWDEEALEAGETNDRGFEVEDQPLTPDEYDIEEAQDKGLDPIAYLALKEISRGGFVEPSSSHPRPGENIWFSTVDDDIDIHSGERTQRAIHFKNLSPDQWTQIINNYKTFR